ncbi:MAG: rhodanese-related sulfurtransferase [Bacteroidetes bacterium]|nr:MAG: rhodanese-related sulfurtransferase [Bacteroidota bacterium]
MDALLTIQHWYQSQCNDEWEHHHGVTIQTLDNPGWMVTIDLTGTNLEKANIGEINHERSETDWIKCWKENEKFRGVGGALNLEEILTVFLSWQANIGKE